MITVADYFMGRRERFPLAMSPAIEREAHRTVALLNALLSRAQADGVALHTNPDTNTLLTSGWRPPAINSTTPGASATSKHMTAQAGDVYDPKEELDAWLMSPKGQAAMAEIGLWHEHPSATKGWAHLQTIPPSSRRRTFYP